jgi:hypothetical protein
VESPKVPVESPKVPVESPKVPVESPKVPVESPKVPVESPKVPEPVPKAESQEDTVMQDRESSESESVTEPAADSGLPFSSFPKRSDIRKAIRIKFKAAPIVSTKMNDSIFAAAPDDIDIF